MTRFESIPTTNRAIEWSYSFANAGIGSEDNCDLEFSFPADFEVPGEKSRLTGQFTALIEPNGTLYLTGFEAELSSFAIPLRDPAGTCHPYQTGRLELCLDPHPSGWSSSHRLPPPNTGFVDLETGFTQLTWGVYAHSPDLHRVHFEPIPVVVSESGFLNLRTMAWQCNGIGVIVGGPIEGTCIRIMNIMNPMSVLGLELPWRIPPNGRAPLRIRYRSTVAPGAPQPDTRASFELSVSVIGAEGGLIGLEASSVELRAGGEAQVDLITEGLALDARVQVCARGAGHCRVASAVVGG